MTDLTDLADPLSSRTIERGRGTDRRIDSMQRVLSDAFACDSLYQGYVAAPGEEELQIETTHLLEVALAEKKAKKILKSKIADSSKRASDNEEEGKRQALLKADARRGEFLRKKMKRRKDGMEASGRRFEAEEAMDEENNNAGGEPATGPCDPSTPSPRDTPSAPSVEVGNKKTKRKRKRASEDGDGNNNNNNEAKGARVNEEDDNEGDRGDDDDDDEDFDDFMFNDDDSMNPVTEHQMSYYLEEKGWERDGSILEKPEDFERGTAWGSMDNMEPSLAHHRYEMGHMIVDKIIEMSQNGQCVTRPKLMDAAKKDHDLISKKEAREWLRVKHNLAPKNAEEAARGPQERNCVRETRCQGYVWTHGKDVLREFLSDKEEAERRATGKLPDNPRRCLRCCRYDAGKDFLNTLSECTGLACNVLLSNHYVATDVAGQYITEQCFQSSPIDYQGLPCPVPIESGRYYKRWVDPVTGKIYHLEKGLMTPEEFAALNPELDMGFR